MRGYQRQPAACSSIINTTCILSLLVVLLMSSQALYVKAQDQGEEEEEESSSSSDQRDYNSPTTTIFIVLVCLFFAAGFVSVYLRHYAWCFGFNNNNRGGGDGGRRRHRDTAGGLDRAVVDSLPTFLYSEVKVHRIGKGVLECAVCLNEFADNDRLRLLPGCSHVFHPDCIDPWLISHVTCPVCRANLQVVLIHHQQPSSRLLVFDPLSSSEDELEPQPHNHHHHDQADGHVHVNRPSPEETRVQVEIKSPVGLEEIKDGPLRKLTRSHSTGHSLREDGDRFTLRLPEELIRHKLNANAGGLNLMHAALVSPTIGYRTRSVGSTAMTTNTNPNRWRFSMTPPFIISPPPKSDQQGVTSTGHLTGRTRGLFKSIKSPFSRDIRSNNDDIGEQSSDWLRPYPPPPSHSSQGLNSTVLKATQ